MTTSYAVQGEYKLVSNAPALLKEIARQFRMTLDAGNDLRSLLEALGRANLSRLGRQLKEIEGINLGGIDSQTRTMSASLDNITSSAGSARKALEELRKVQIINPKVSVPSEVPLPSPKPPLTPEPEGRRVPGRPETSFGHAANKAMAVGFDLQMYGDMAKTALRPAMDLQQMRQRLIANDGGDTKDADKAIVLARDLQKKVAGSDVMGNLEVYSVLKRITQSASEARTLLPTFLPIGIAAGAYHPESGNYAAQLESLMQLAEFRGALVKTDKKTGKQEVDVEGARNLGTLLLAAEVATLGNVDFKKYLQFSRSAGAAGATLKAEDLPWFIPLLQSMGTARAGTGLQGFSQQFMAGRMSEAGANMLIDMGIIHGGGDAKSNKYLRKMGMGQFMMLDGALDPDDMAKIIFSPHEFIEKTLKPKIDKYMAKVYGKKFTDASPEMKLAMEAKGLSQVASRIPGGVSMIETLRTYLLAERDSSATGKLSHADIVGIMKNSPSVQIDAFTASIKNLTTVLGDKPFKDGLAALGLLTNTLNFTARQAEKHPNVVPPLATAGVDLGVTALAVGFFHWVGGALEKYLPSGMSKFGTVTKGASKGFMPLAAGLAAWDVLSPWANKLQASLEKNNETLKSIDGFLGKYSGGLFGTAPINVTVNLDGKQIAGHVQSVVRKDYDREMRASNAMPDPLSTPRVPGVPGW
ncbi:hypothetical protein [Acetobacter ascendens]|uniref:Uncharacterized protein n=1 Tax=Acetobacter ascendens TaxID=481146 RepID=A0A1Y0V236_9PROT|nr:hypothetical protein [Acetobacter ascendens]ARW09979.1 hypothetical protein S101447_00877 [Acetobacter ascendens]